MKIEKTTGTAKEGNLKVEYTINLSDFDKVEGKTPNPETVAQVCRALSENDRFAKAIINTHIPVYLRQIGHDWSGNWEEAINYVGSPANQAVKDANRMSKEDLEKQIAKLQAMLASK